MSVQGTMTTRNTVFLVFLIIIIITAAVSGAVIRAATTPINAPAAGGASASKAGRMGGSTAEGFYDESKPNKNDVLGPYLKRYFSNGATEHTVEFVPSVADVACMTMTSDVSDYLNCDTARLDSVSVRDDRVVHMPGHEGCNSMLASKQPSNPTDAEVRMLNGMYRLHKSCLVLPFSRMTVVDPDTVKLTLDTLEPSTIFFMLNRPTFLATDSSYLYEVRLMGGRRHHTRADHMYRGLNAARILSKMGTGRHIDIELRRVPESQILGNPEARTLQDLFDPYGDAEEDEKRTMSATLFYLRYQGPIEIGTVRLRFDRQEAVTLVIPVSSSRSSTSTVFDSSSSSSPRIRVRVSPDSARLRIGDEESLSVPLRQRGYLVITYATNMVVMCFMSRESVFMKQVIGVNKLTVTNPTLFSVTAQGAGAAPPSITHPASLFSIANLYDIYIRLVSFS